jgi:hypothetical protein
MDSPDDEQELRDLCTAFLHLAHYAVLTENQQIAQAALPICQEAFPDFMFRGKSLVAHLQDLIYSIN